MGWTANLWNKHDYNGGLIVGRTHLWWQVHRFDLTQERQNLTSVSWNILQSPDYFWHVPTGMRSVGVSFIQSESLTQTRPAIPWNVSIVKSHTSVHMCSWSWTRPTNWSNKYVLSRTCLCLKITCLFWKNTWPASQVCRGWHIQHVYNGLSRSYCLTSRNLHLWKSHMQLCVCTFHGVVLAHLGLCCAPHPCRRMTSWQQQWWQGLGQDCR